MAAKSSAVTTTGTAVDPAHQRRQRRQAHAAHDELLAEARQHGDHQDRDERVGEVSGRERRVNGAEGVEVGRRRGRDERLHLHQAGARDPERGAEQDRERQQAPGGRSRADDGGPASGIERQRGERGHRQEQRAHDDLRPDREARARGQQGAAADHRQDAEGGQGEGRGQREGRRGRRGRRP